MSKNIRKKIRPQKQKINSDFLYQEIIEGNTVALGKAVTLIESTLEAHQLTAQNLIEKCLPHTGKSIRIGITGVPGVGKSTFIESLGNYLIKEHHKKVAVLAIDPSSKKSGGSILGDKTRMNLLATNKNAFIRPSPSSGTLGGVSKASRETIILCEAAGFNVILIETVGVGQSETTVKSMVDFFLLLMLAGAGDELQGIKRGIMEMADAILINKADNDNITAANLAKNAYKNALHLFPANENNWTPKVETCSALENKNIAKIWKIIDDYMLLTKANSFFEKNRKNQAKLWFTSTIDNSIKTLFYNNNKIKKLITDLEQKVVNHEISPYKAAKTLISSFKR